MTEPVVPGMEGAAQMQHYLDAGFSPQEVGQYKQQKSDELLTAGFKPSEVDHYFGKTAPDYGKFDSFIQGNLSNLSPLSAEKVAQNPWEMLSAGWQHGDMALLAGKPTIGANPDSGLIGKAAYSLGQLVGDAPVMAGGLVGGAAVGGPIGAGAGAAAAPEFIRQVLMDHYTHPEGVRSFKDLWDRGTDVAWNMVKAGAVGAVMGPAAKFGEAGAIAAGLGRATATGAGLSAMTLASAGVGAGLEGHMPSMDDVILGGAMVIGFHAAGTVVGATRRFVVNDAGKQMAQNVGDVYALTGLHPQQIGSMALTDPGLTSELLGPRNSAGEVVTPGFEAMRLPDPKPFEIPKPGDPITALGDYLDALASVKGEGFDRVTAEQALRKLPSDITERMDTTIVAVQDGVEAARAWDMGGHDIDTLPIKTQRMLEHLENNGFLEGSGWAERLKMRTMGEGMPEHGVIEASEVPPDWSQLGTGPMAGQVVIRLRGGQLVPAPEAIVPYLQAFGRAAGFEFRVIPPVRLNRYGQIGQVGATIGPNYTYNSATGTRYVAMPSNSQEFFQRWWGQSREQILYHEAGHGIDITAMNGAVNRTAANLGRSHPLVQEMIEASKSLRPSHWQRARPSQYIQSPKELAADAIAMWLSDPTAAKRMPLFTQAFGEHLAPYKAMADKYLPTRTRPYETMDGEGNPVPPPPGEEPPTGPEWVPPKEGPGTENLPVAGGGGGDVTVPPKDVGFPNGEPPPRPDPLNMNDRMLADVIMDQVAPETKQGIIPDWMKFWKWPASFQSFLQPARSLDRALEIDPRTFGINDALRNGILGSRERFGAFFQFGTFLPVEGDPSLMRKTSDASIVGALKAVKKNGGNIRDFVAYMLAARTVEKQGYGIETGVPIDVAGALMNNKEANAKYSEAHDIWRNVMNGIVDYAVATKRFSPELGEAMKEMNYSYITMRRVQDPTYNPYEGGKVFGARGMPRIMEGGNEKFIDPFTATLDNMKFILGIADHNQGVGRMLDLIKQKGGAQAVADAGIQKVTDVPRIAHTKVEILDAFGNPIPAPKEMAPAVDAFLAMREGQGRLGRDNFPYFPGDGSMQIWRAKDPELAALLTTSWPGDPGWGWNVLHNFASIQRSGITGNLGFTLRSLWHGQIAQAIAGRDGMMPFTNIMKGFMSTWKQDETFQAFMAYGGGGSMVGEDMLSYYHDTNKIFNETGVMRTVMNKMTSPIQALREMGHFTEMAARVGTFKHMVEENNYAPGKAAMIARTNHLDFAEKATSQFVQNWARSVPFMTVGLKDIEQVTNALRDQPAAFLTKGIAAITLPSLALAAINGLLDPYLPVQERYEEIAPAWRMMFWITPPVSGHRLWIPKPYVMSYLFGTIPEAFARWAVGQGKLGWGDMANMFGQQVLPSMLPVAGVPVAEQYTNKNFLTGHPLIPDRLAKMSGYMQYTPNTSESAKQLATLIGPTRLNMGDVSPITIQNYVQQWGGTLPMTILRLLDEAIRPPGRPWDIADTPMVGSFTRRNPGMTAESIEKFYVGLHDLTARREDLRSAMKQQNFGQIQDARMLQLGVKLDGYQKAINGAINTLDAINRTDRLTRDEKLKYSDMLTGRAILMAKSGLELLDQANKAHQ